MESAESAVDYVLSQAIDIDAELVAMVKERDAQIAAHWQAKLAEVERERDAACAPPTSKEAVKWAHDALRRTIEKLAAAEKALVQARAHFNYDCRDDNLSACFPKAIAEIDRALAALRRKP